MPKGLKRIHGFGHLHFITFSCYRRLPLLNSAHCRNLFVEVLSEVRDRYHFPLVGYVVMPEHVHLLIGEPRARTVSTVIQMLKQKVSRSVCIRDRDEKPHPQKPRTGHPQNRVSVAGLPSFWQTHFYDFNVWTLKKKNEKLQYMHMNPVKRGLVERPDDWLWSSFCFYQGNGKVLLPIDRVD